MRMKTATLSRAEQLSRGQVVLVQFPYADGAGEKLRPAIFLSDAAVCRGSPEGHFVFIGSQEPPPWVQAIAVLEGSDAAKQMRLKFDAGRSAAYIRVLTVQTVAMSIVTDKLGTTPPSIMLQISDKLGRALGLNSLTQTPERPEASTSPAVPRASL